jgi:hypothetical protein
MVDSPKGNINSGWSIDSARLWKNIVAKVWELQSTSAAAFRNGKLPPKLYPLSWIRFYFIYIYNIFLVINLENGTGDEDSSIIFYEGLVWRWFWFFLWDSYKKHVFLAFWSVIYALKRLYLKKKSLHLQVKHDYIIINNKFIIPTIEKAST